MKHSGILVKLFAHILVLSLLLIKCTATLSKEQQAEKKEALPSINGEGSSPRTFPQASKPSMFPRHLDISALGKMPMIILHPRNPIHFSLLPGENVSSFHKSLNPSKILEILKSASFNLPSRAMPTLPSRSMPALPREEKRQGRKANFKHHEKQLQPSTTSSFQAPQSFFRETNPANTDYFQRSGYQHQFNNGGWFERMKSSFSNVFPISRPLRMNLFGFGSPSTNFPTFLPHGAHQNSYSSPLMMNSNQNSYYSPWRGYPSSLQLGELSPESSYLQPMTAFSNQPHFLHYGAQQNIRNPFIGDLTPSGSALMPNRILPHVNHQFSRYAASIPRHRPLFNNVEGIDATGLEISNAFADFTDTKEHGPRVSQSFGSVGHSINNFLKMMGLGTSIGLTADSPDGFGGAGSWASLDATPIARSMDFYPGYGNQANLDDMEDLPIFHEDITEQFMAKMNLTNSTSLDISKEQKEKKKDGDVKKEIHIVMVPVKKKEDSKTTIDLAPTKSVGDVKDRPDLQPIKYTHIENNKDKSNLGNDYPKTEAQNPLVNYQVPHAFPTVAPHDRKPPVAIYISQPNSDSKYNNPPDYAQAEPLQNHETKPNHNKLVDEDVTRHWVPVFSNYRFVEKRPMPQVDLQNEEQPEGLKLLHKLVSNS